VDIDKDVIRSYFATLGLEAEIADLYLALHLHGPQTISKLSRSSGVERTRIYRLLGRLREASLVEVESHYKRSIIKAAPIANLRILINQKEGELEALQGKLDILEQALVRSSLSSPTTRVQFYHGPEGIRQMLWNELQNKSGLLGYRFQILDAGTGLTFMDRWAVEFESQNLRCRVLYGDDFVQSWHNRRPPGRRIDGVEYRFIDPNIFPITHSCDVYDDVTLYFNWRGEEVFGIEIYNQQIADAQRVLLHGLWDQSTPETRF
jgi:DNA-binding transcriptional ArsR family regulator